VFPKNTCQTIRGLSERERERDSNLSQNVLEINIVNTLEITDS